MIRLKDEMKKEEAHIIACILRGDSRSFAILVERYSPQIFALIVQIVENREDAEELTQDTFLKAYDNLKKFKQDSSFATWIYRIAYNTALDATRKKKKTIYVEEEKLAFLSDAQIDEMLDDDSDENCEKLKLALARLTGEEKTLLSFFYEEEKSIREIAEITSETESNIKVKLHRTRQKLAGFMKGC